jgi:hypothetical protein
VTAAEAHPCGEGCLLHGDARELTTAEALAAAVTAAERAAELLCYAASHMTRPSGVGGVWLMVTMRLTELAAQAGRLAGDVANASEAVGDVSELVRRAQVNP